MLSLVLLGCAQVDPTEDFAVTARLIKERTGSPDAYEPALDDEAIEGSIRALLADGLTTEEAVRIALLRNPTLRAMFEDVGISRAELVRAGLPSNPFFFLSARLPEQGGLLNVTTSLTQNLMDLLLLPARKRARQAELQASRFAAARHAVQLAGRVKRTAYEILALQRASRLGNEELTLARRSLGLAQRRLAAGLGDVIDVNLARAGVSEVHRSLLVLQRDLRLREAALDQLMGGGLPSWSLVGELPRPESIAKPAALEALARHERLDLRVAKLTLTAAEEQIGIEKENVVPDLSVGFERERAEKPPSLTGPTVSGSLPLWQQNQPGIARASFLARRAHRRMDAVMDSALLEVRQAAIAVKSDGKLIGMFEQNVLPLARSNVTAASRAYQGGQRDVLVLLETQRSLITQRRAYVATLRDYATALADLEQAVGGKLEHSP